LATEIKIELVKKRDNNAAYIHRIANGKRRKKMIFSLQRNDDIV
jgi:hypothetical protein